MKIILSICILSFTSLLYASISNDSIYTKQIVGSIWVANYKLPNWTLYVESLYKKDGTKEGRGKICKFQKCQEFKSLDTWRIKNNVLITNSIFSSVKDFPSGMTFYDKIISITEKEMILFSTEGNEFKRIKTDSPKYFKLSEIEPLQN